MKNFENFFGKIIVHSNHDSGRRARVPQELDPGDATLLCLAEPCNKKVVTSRSP